MVSGKDWWGWDPSAVRIRNTGCPWHTEVGSLAAFQEGFLEAAVPQRVPEYPRWSVPQRGNQRKVLPDRGRLPGPTRAKKELTK